MGNVYKELFLTTTDTVVGIGAPISVKNKEAIMNIKARSHEKKFIVMVASLEEAKKLNGWTRIATNFAKEVWPGATTLVINDDLAVRVPNNKGLQKLLKLKGPCYMTSANISGRETLCFEEAKKTFGEIKEYYDFGKGSKTPSTIFDIRTGEVLR